MKQTQSQTVKLKYIDGACTLLCDGELRMTREQPPLTLHQVTVVV